MRKLSQDTLVLNKSWMAVQTCSVRRAILLLYQGHAKVLDINYQSYDFKDWSQVSKQMAEVSPAEFISSPSLSIRIPRVIVLLFYDKIPKREIKFSRKNIFKRDNYMCQYCGAQPLNKTLALKWIEENSLNLDHIVSRSKGGKTTWNNIVTSCSKCNSKKGNKTLKELGWKLKSVPKKPKWSPSLTIPLTILPYEEWLSFLDADYENTKLFKKNSEVVDDKS